MDSYSSRIQLYKDCIEFLRQYSHVNESILKGSFRFISPIRTIIEILLELDAIFDDGISYVSTENTLKYKFNRYFENKIDELEAARSRDMLSERSTRSAEESAKAAKESVIAANRSADSAEKANILSEISNEKADKANSIANEANILSEVSLSKSKQANFRSWLSIIIAIGSIAVTLLIHYNII